MCLTFSSSSTPSLVFMKKVLQWFSKLRMAFGVILPAVKIGGCVKKGCETVAIFGSDMEGDLFMAARMAKVFLVGRNGNQVYLVENRDNKSFGTQEEGRGKRLCEPLEYVTGDVVGLQRRLQVPWVALVFSPGANTDVF
ncbi:hypothetical protein EDB85DRAFT_1886237 [Lactarius pseudohatsudake]|nr:hypothetical protein EDB85DRAFT_1886237 [Lactarius pseudohatsudake]